VEGGRKLFIMAKNYENLEIWKEAIKLAALIYKETKKFPKEELYGIISQLRRAVISISANIAEGAGRSSKIEFIRFVNIALGSLNEVESLLYVSLDLKYLDEEKFLSIKNQIEKLGKFLGGFKNYLKK
jgi:four helix bundle protein